MAGPNPEGGDTTKAAVAYILTWLTGLIVYLIADDDDTYARWHALQAIGLGIAVTIVYWILSAIGAALLVGTGTPTGFFGASLLAGVWGLLAFILILVLAYKTYQGESIRLPVIADIADDHA